MGKTTTAKMFADAGIAVWDADAAVHKLYAKDGQASQLLQDEFGDVLTDNAVDRAKLKSIIAQDKTALARIEAIIHPLLVSDRAAFIETAASDILLFDIPLLFETGADKWLDAVAVVSVDAQIQRERVLARGTMDASQFEFILSRQMPDAQKRAKARWVIPTLTLEGARAAVTEVIAEIRQEQANA